MIKETSEVGIRKSVKSMLEMMWKYSLKLQTDKKN